MVTWMVTVAAPADRPRARPAVTTPTRDNCEVALSVRFTKTVFHRLSEPVFMYVTVGKSAL